MFGWRREEIHTVDLWFKTAYPNPAYQAEMRHTWAMMVEETELQGRSYSDPKEAKIYCKDGSEKTCAIRYYRKHQYIFSVFTDISAEQAIQRQLHALSITDPLTQLFNRRHFNYALEEMWQLSKELEVPLTIILCDIDNFKSINDGYGHLAGDQVLIAVAQCIQSAINHTTDVSARFGGEEFVIMRFPGCSDDAIELCESLQKALSNIESFPREAAEVPPVTMSFGVSTRIAHTTYTPEAFVNEADRAMYRAKVLGKNRVEVFCCDNQSV